mgnify:FL=1
MSTTWIGAKQLTLKPDGVTIDYTDRLVATLQYQGPYELCVAKRPARGSYVAGYNGMRVDRAVVSKASAPGFGELTVYLSKAAEEEGDEADPVTEVFWLELERDLAANPRYQTGGDKALTIADRQQLALWMDQANPSRKASFIWDLLNPQGVTLSSGTLSANAQDFATKIAKGTDSWFDYTPIAVKITFRRTKPSSVRLCGKRISGKPFDACPNGFEWLRTEDRHTRTGRHGKWQRTERFTGALSWDPDLYGADA